MTDLDLELVDLGAASELTEGFIVDTGEEENLYEPVAR